MTGFPGLGTVINVVAIVIGSGLGLVIGHRLPERTRHVVTDVLGLMTILLGALSAAAITSEALRSEVGAGFPVLIVLASLVIGGVIGSLLHVEARLETLGLWLRRRLVPHEAETSADNDGEDSSAVDLSHELGVSEQATPAARFVEGFVTASLLFCIGPLAILGPVSDGLGRGIDQLLLKSVLDGFASVAFAASLGVGVMLSALAVLVYQGLFTLLGVVLGGALSEAQIAALTVTGGVMLVGIGLRLLQIRPVPVADLLPALIFAPLAVSLVASLR